MRREKNIKSLKVLVVSTTIAIVFMAASVVIEIISHHQVDSFAVALLGLLTCTYCDAHKKLKKAEAEIEANIV